MRSIRVYTTTKLYKEMMGFVFGVVLVLPPLLFAQSVTLPFTFSNGDVADANQVNANFTALQDAIINNGVRIDIRANTGRGLSQFQSLTTGDSNTALGFTALVSLTTGRFNTAFGVDALQSSTTGNQNTAVGADSLFANTTGAGNTAVGTSALRAHTRGSGNTAVGQSALLALADIPGSRNIAVGSDAGRNLTSGNDNIYLGHPGVDTEFSTMRLGDEDFLGSTFIAGITGVPVTGSAVLISSEGQLGIQASSSRYKRDIHPMGAHSRGLLQLRPVVFRYKQDAEGKRQYGLIAEEVAKVYPELVTRGANGEVESVRYHEVIPMLLNELQQQQRQLAELQAQNARLRAAVVQQQKRDERQQAQTAALAARLQRLEEAVTRAAPLASR